MNNEAHIKAHIKAHLSLYNETTGNAVPEDNQAQIGEQLAKAWRHIERKAHRLAERECNEYVTPEYVAREEKAILASIKAMYSGNLPESFFLNGDPRGYACKLKEDAAKRHGFRTDWGGYGILSDD